MSYIVIQPHELVGFLECRGYRRMRDLEGWKETAFGLARPDRNLIIVVPTSFDQDGQREIGKDSIKTYLALMDDPAKSPVFSLKHTKRIASWKENLEPKLELLEEILRLVPCCRECGRPMLPRCTFKPPPRVFWGCQAYVEDGCDGTRWSISNDLQERLTKEHKKNSR